MTDPRVDQVIAALLGPQSGDEQCAEARWLDRTKRALVAPRRRRRACMTAALAAAAAVLVWSTWWLVESRREPPKIPLVELDVLGAVRAVADGRAYDATHVRFRERLELETSAAAAGRIAAGRDAVWWTGFLVLITEHDPAFRIEEENMARTTVRIGPWMLAVLAGSLSWNEPATGAAAAEPAATRTPLDPVAAPSAPAGEQIMMRGRVLDPVGAPLNGASVCVIPSHYSKTPLTAIASVRSDADGRFTIAFDPKACDYFENTQLEPWRNADLVATAQGFGPAWVACGNVSGNDATLRLAYDLPIEGRVVDLEAQPVAGARVAVVSLMAPESGDLSDHLRRFSLGEMPWGPGRRVTSLSTSVLPSASVATDADGRFTLSGIGRERMVTLEISGETTALTRATVVTRVMEPFTHQITQGELSMPELDRVWGAHFEIAAEPTQPIEGVVRDAATGEPLAGVKIESYQWGNLNWVEVYRVSTTSGSDGRYRLVGMPKVTSATCIVNGSPVFRGNSLRVMPGDEQCYLMRDVEVPQAPGLATIQLDLELHRGIWIEGTVTDADTGEPLRARMSYHPFYSNPFAQRLPEFPVGQPGAHGAQDRYRTREDGSYRIPGLPGRAIVGAQCFGTKPYREGVGSEHIEGVDKYGHFPVWGYPVPASRKNPTTMAEIHLPEGATSYTCDLEADPGTTVHVKLVDVRDQPVFGCTVRNASRTAWSRDPLARAELDIPALAQDEKRPVFIHHTERNIGQVIRVSPGAENITVKLQACATITGRLLDHLGDPATGATISLELNPGGEYVPMAASTTTDEVGRFTITSVLAGTNYSLMVNRGAIYDQISDKVTVKPGETLDLGDVRLKERE